MAAAEISSLNSQLDGTGHVSSAEIIPWNANAYPSYLSIREKYLGDGFNLEETYRGSFNLVEVYSHNDNRIAFRIATKPTFEIIPGEDNPQLIHSSNEEKNKNITEVIEEIEGTQDNWKIASKLELAPRL